MNTKNAIQHWTYPNSSFAIDHSSFFICPKRRKRRLAFFGGGRWIRTTEVSDNRFTVAKMKLTFPLIKKISMVPTLFMVPFIMQADQVVVRATDSAFSFEYVIIIIIFSYLSTDILVPMSCYNLWIPTQPVLYRVPIIFLLLLALSIFYIFLPF